MGIVSCEMPEWRKVVRSGGIWKLQLSAGVRPRIREVSHYLGELLQYLTAFNKLQNVSLYEHARLKDTIRYLTSELHWSKVRHGKFHFATPSLISRSTGHGVTHHRPTECCTPLVWTTGCNQDGNSVFKNHPVHVPRRDFLVFWRDCLYRSKTQKWPLSKNRCSDSKSNTIDWYSASSRPFDI